MASNKTSETNLKAVCDIRVRFNETDPLGVVWHGNYIKYFEDGREAFGRQFGISYLDVKKYGYATPIVKSSCEHKLPLRYGEVASIETTFINTPSAKMIFSYKILNEKDEVVCLGKTTQVFVNDNYEMSLWTPEFFEIWKKEQGI